MKIVMVILLVTSAMVSQASECVNKGENVYDVDFSVTQSENCVVMTCNIPSTNIIKSLAHCEEIHKDFTVCGWNNSKKTTEANIRLSENDNYIVSKKQCGS